VHLREVRVSHSAKLEVQEEDLPARRLGQMREFPLALAANPYYTYTLKPMEHPTAEQQAIYNSWLGIK